ncbi:hypothetical protein H2203_004046 [Taxawa tesnikishii (nom. ined.)]|nr:hypothetical protein H2203_004046 [Dothideales sp. JES 119]
MERQLGGQTDRVARARQQQQQRLRRRQEQHEPAVLSAAGGERVPATVTLTHAPEIGGREGAPEAVVVVWKTNPLPAIFPPELGASARQAGKKGVLHTVWAKKRLQVLQKEIEAESRINAEGVGLLMAIQEKEWIEQNFGVTTKPSGISIPTGQGAMGGVLGSPTSPRSPGGGRLMEKLRGLKLGTSERDLGARKENGTENGLGLSNPLSPEQSDHAVSSFGSFAALKGMPDTSTLGAKPAQPPQQQQQPLRQMAAQRPPESILAQQRQVGTTSLNAFADQHTHTGLAPIHPDEDKEDDLFALPMSPRSPEDSRSPFSFGAEDTMRYLQRIERV